jgi:hypothetical protein
MNIFCRTRDGEERCSSFLTFDNLFGKIINAQVKEVPVLTSVLEKFKDKVEVVFTLKNNLEENEVSLMDLIEEIAKIIDYALYKKLPVAEEKLIYRLAEYVIFAYTNNVELVLSSV